MSAVKLNIEWLERIDAEEFSPSLQTGSKEFQTNRSPLSREIAPAQVTLRCPHCHSIVYSRLHKLCGVCSRALPTELLFSSSEAQRIQNILRSEKRRHRQWMTKAFDQAVAIPYLE